MKIILYIYIALMLVVACRLGAYVVFKLDRYDWRYNKMEIWVALALGVIAWPLVLAKPRILLDPSILFSNKYGIAARARKRDELLREPPLCGEVVRWRQDHSRFGEETFGEFLFPAASVEKVLRERLRSHPHLANDDEGGILNWLIRRERTYSAPTDVPTFWSRFQYVANELIREGEGRVRCRECSEVYATGALVPKDDKGKAGWIVDRLSCPRGHNLLIVEVGHILLREKPVAP